MQYLSMELKFGVHHVLHLQNSKQSNKNNNNNILCLQCNIQAFIQKTGNTYYILKCFIVIHNFNLLQQEQHQHDLNTRHRTNHQHPCQRLQLFQISPQYADIQFYKLLLQLTLNSVINLSSFES